MRNVTRMFFLMTVGLSVLLVSACNKDDENTKEKAHLSVRMTDAPANYDAVLIDLQAVEVTGNNGGLIILNTNAGIYNLLNFSNGLDTLIATGYLDAGTISQIRLILGPDNSVIVDNVAYPLSTPSAQQSGLKLQVHQTFEPGVAYMLLLDFDANQSVILTGNGKYQLKPVIRVIDAALSGSIKGHISPSGIMSMITATSGGISYSSASNATGQFLLPGLPAGIYDVIINPEIPYTQVTITNVAVVTGVSTDLGLIVI
ncbi:MAG: DUF4382 domain-containing protein [Lentimicrobium sp.]|nr:DUF4382 domain-containing protein [Lentimicrobium sp.]